MFFTLFFLLFLFFFYFFLFFLSLYDEVNCPIAFTILAPPLSKWISGFIISMGRSVHGEGACFHSLICCHADGCSLKLESKQRQLRHPKVALCRLPALLLPLEHCKIPSTLKRGAFSLLMSFYFLFLPTGACN